MPHDLTPPRPLASPPAPPQLQQHDRKFEGPVSIKREECPATTSSDDASSDEDDTVTPGGHRLRDKEWAALTTWLRMNLHQPRTLKKQVLFVGRLEPDTKRWTFDLNPQLSWDDVSLETKLRLRTLPQETEAAFSRKYPKRPAHDWAKKTQKYRPQGCAANVVVPLGDMVTAMRDIYFRHEQTADAADAAPAPAR